MPQLCTTGPLLDGWEEVEVDETVEVEVMGSTELEVVGSVDVEVTSPLLVPSTDDALEAEEDVELTPLLLERSVVLLERSVVLLERSVVLLERSVVLLERSVVLLDPGREVLLATCEELPLRDVPDMLEERSALEELAGPMLVAVLLDAVTHPLLLDEVSSLSSSSSVSDLRGQPVPSNTAKPRHIQGRGNPRAVSLMHHPWW